MSPRKSPKQKEQRFRAIIHNPEDNQVVLRLVLKRVNVEKELELLRKNSKEKAIVHLGKVLHHVAISATNDPLQILREASQAVMTENEDCDKRDDLEMEREFVNPLTGLPTSFNVGLDANDPPISNYLKPLIADAPCKYCGQEFSNPSNLWSHILTQHNANEKGKKEKNKNPSTGNVVDKPRQKFLKENSSWGGKFKSQVNE